MVFKDMDILLVEDNPHDAELTLRALKKHHLANKVHVAKDGEEALDFIFGPDPSADTKCNRLKVILLDLKLPKVSGLEVLKRLKSDDRCKSIPVVVLTSSHEDRDIQECYKLGVNSYVVKPVEFEAFAKTVADMGFYWLLVNKRP
ncbi:MAG TPA: response regulator [Desulfobaccales bacterium]